MCPSLSATAKMNNTYYGKCNPYATSEILWEGFYDQGLMDTGRHKSKYQLADFPWNIEIRVKGDSVVAI